MDIVLGFLNSLSAVLFLNVFTVSHLDRAPTSLINQFYQWISNPESNMYHPEIKREVDQLIHSMLLCTVKELKNLETNVVKADCTSIIIATGKQNVSEAKG